MNLPKSMIEIQLDTARIELNTVELVIAAAALEYIGLYKELQEELARAQMAVHSLELSEQDA